MDKIDREIIEHLRKDARLSWRELGDAVGLAANTVAERVRRLLGEGVLEGFEARVNPEALGLTVHALIDVKMRPGVPADRFEAALQTIPGIIEATVMTGSYDYMLRVACHDHAHLMRVIETLREKAGVQDTYSRVILRSKTVRGLLP